MDGLNILLGQFSTVLTETGDPCLQPNGGWNWVVCSNDDTPRDSLYIILGFNIERVIGAEVRDIKKMYASTFYYSIIQN